MRVAALILAKEQESQDHCSAFIAPISSLAPHPVELIKPIHAVVRFTDGAYVASFMDANINGSGESELEAFEMLKEMIVDLFEFMTDNEGTLGDEPRRQLTVLRQFLRGE